MTYDTELRLLAVGETSGDIRVFRSGKQEEVCCLPLPRRAAKPSAALLDPKDAAVLGRGKDVAVTCLRPWAATNASSSVLLASCE